MVTYFDAVNKVWTGEKDETSINKHQSFGKIILDKLKSDPDRVMQIDGDTGKSLTKAEVRIRSIRCAQNLTESGCTSNDRIAIIARNHHNLTPLLFGAFCIGTPIAPLDVVLIKDEMFHILQKIRPTFIFCDDDVLDSVKDITKNIGLITKLFTVKGVSDGIDSMDMLLNETGDEDSFVCTKLSDAYSHMAVISCSSGSTGFPKSICISHALLSFQYEKPKNITEEYSFVLLCFSSFYWLTGILTAVSSAIKTTRIFTANSFKTDLFFNLVEKYKVNLFLGPPSQLQAALKSDRCEDADLSSLKCCFPVGSYIPSNLTQAMKRIMPKCYLITLYGMTEIGIGITVTKPNELEEYPNSVGCLSPGIQIKIINTETGEKCGINERGEIYIKHSIPPMGYYQNEEANKAAFDAEGYFITGDIGIIDASGRLSITGRKREIFKHLGYFVKPAELENIIVKNSCVRDVCVVNVFDDNTASDLPAAVVVRRGSSSITENEVYCLISDQLASHKRLEGGVYFVAEFPLTANGKIARAKVREIAQRLFLRKQLNQPTNRS